MTTDTATRTAIETAPRERLAATATALAITDPLAAATPAPEYANPQAKTDIDQNGDPS